ncbi:MAG: isoaspartyl peptidase [Oligoflexia bacterium]|nr:isoaspartyl peptidase [Oligoflexia bacterium]
MQLKPKPEHTPIIVIHGGAGRALPGSVSTEVAAALRGIATIVYDSLLQGGSALDAVVSAVRRLENHPRFNAGTGARLQIDGRARLSSAVMDGATERFGGVVNVEGLLNPVLLSRALLDDDDRVLAGEGALARARELRLDLGEVRTAQRISQWRTRTGLPLPPLDRTGTVGAVARDREGLLAAATSTGGRGFEAVGRVSDTPTVAATYANDSAAVSLTGVGEHIVDGALGARLVALVEAGQSLDQARDRLLAQQRRRQWQAGFIAVDAGGAWVAAHSTPGMSWWAIDDRGPSSFLS